MTKPAKTMKTKSKLGTNFIKLDTSTEEPHEKENDEPVPEQTIKRKLVISGSKEAAKSRGVVYISHLPHGFYENQLRKYFAQFGSVTNLKVGRSNKTGASRGHAFVEFRFHEVAKTVAETMNNYLFFDKLLKCEVVPEEKVRPSMFRNKVNPRKPPAKKARSLAKRQVNKERDERQEQKRRRKQLQGLKKTAAKLQALGVNYNLDFPTIEKEISERKIRLKASGGKTPTMQVDDSDVDITLKTPPNVRKIKSRSNSTATPRQGSLRTTKASTPKNILKKRKLAMKAVAGKENALQAATAKIISETRSSNEIKNASDVSAKRNQKKLPPKSKITDGIVGGTPKIVKKPSITKLKRRST